MLFRSKYNIEDGHFILKHRISDALKAKVEKKGIKLHETFYKQPITSKNHKLRIFILRKKINVQDLLEGKLPEKSDEIADVADGVLTAKSGKTFKLADGEFPTIEDYVAETVEAYAGDANEFFSTESTNSDNQSILSYAKDTFISDLGSQDPEMGEGIPNISGIRKVDDYTASKIGRASCRERV